MTPKPKTKGMDLAKIERGVRLILEGVGEDPDRPDLRGTPRRVARMYAEILGGLHESPETHLRQVHEERHDEMVLIKNIPLYSMCEHHMLPFAGVAHVAYIPKGGRIVGLSKIARVVDLYARRLQVQERLTQEIATALMDTLQPHGVAVVIEAFHLCMMMRGVEKTNSKAVTSAMLGVFRTRNSTRMEFMELIKPNLNIVR